MLLQQWKNDNLMIWDRQKRITWQDLAESNVDYIVVKLKGYQLYTKTALMAYFLDKQKTTAFLSELKPLSGVAMLSGRESAFDAISVLKSAQVVMVRAAVLRFGKYSPFGRYRSGSQSVGVL